MIQTAVVGYGTAGKYFHAYLISLEPGLHLAAISTRNPNAQAAAQYDYPHARIYGSLDGLLQVSGGASRLGNTPPYPQSSGNSGSQCWQACGD